MVVYNNVLAGAAGQGGDAGYKIERSLRFNSADSPSLVRQVSTKGNTKQFTWAGWVKRGKLGGAARNLFSGSTGTDQGAYLCFPDNASNALGAADSIVFKADGSGGGGGSVGTVAVFRDPSAWYHVILVVDTTQATATNRVKIWVNGVNQTLTVTAGAFPSQNAEYSVNDVGYAAIGAEANGSASNTRFFGDFYLADVHFLDGIAVNNPDGVFGEFSDTGIWNPIEYTGSHNGAAGVNYSSQTITNENSGYPTARMFDGVYGASASLNNSVIANATDGTYSVYTFANPISYSSSVRIYGDLDTRSTDPDIKANNTSVTGVTDNVGLDSSNKKWYTVLSGSGTLSTVSLNQHGGYVAAIYAIEVDGTVLVTSSAPAGVNGYYLDFSDSSSSASLGNDAAGSNNFTVNNLAVSYATYSADSNWSTDANYLLDKSSPFNGTDPNAKINESTGAITGANSRGVWSNTARTYIRWDAPTPIPITSGVDFYAGAYNDAAEVASLEIGYTDGTTTTGTFTSSSNSWMGRLSGVTSGKSLDYVKVSCANSCMTAVRVNGVFLDDSYPHDVDSVVDSPTDYTADSGNNGGNYPTYLANATIRSTNGGVAGVGSYSNGNLISTGQNQWSHGLSSIAIPSTGKWYCEMYGKGQTHGGIATFPKTLDQVVRNSATSNSVDYSSTGTITRHIAGRSSATVASGKANWNNYATLGIAVNSDDGELKFYLDGTLQYTYALPAELLARLNAGEMHFMSDVYYSSNNISVNFGQQGFVQTPPTGFKSLCTKNLPTPSIEDPSTAFDTSLYAGNGSSQTISGLNHSPDFLWIKVRNDNISHYLSNTVVGINKNLEANNTQGESTDNGYGYVSAATSDGFTVTAGSSSSVLVNGSSKTYAAWSWEGGDLATTSDTTNYNQGQALSAVTKAGSTTYSPTDSDTGFLNAYPPSNAFNGSGTSGVCYTNNNSVWIYVQLATAITVSSTIKFGARNTVEVKINGTSYSYTGGDSTANHTTRTISFSGSLTEFAIRDDDNSGYSTGLSFLEIDGKQLIDPGVITAGSLNSSVYNQSYNISPNISTSSITFGSNQGLDKWFNGNKSDKMEPAGSGSLDFTSISGLQNFSGTLQFAVTAYNPNSSLKFVINSSTDNLTFTADTFPASGAFPATLVTIPVTSLRTLDFTSVSGRSVQFWGVYLDGKLLVDSSQTPPDVPSISSTVRANPSAGFSIASFVGNGTSGTTISHGLNGAVPKMVIFKNRDASADWRVYNTMSDGSLDILYLNSSVNKNNSSLVTHTGNVFSVGSSSSTNGNGNNIVAYSFAPIENYSVFNSYIGNGLASGPFVYTGHSPAWVMIKRTDSSNNWVIYDTARDTYNIGGRRLYADMSDAEGQNTSHYIDIYSNGFKVTSAAGNLLNASGGTYIYAAFASNPLKYARAR